MKRILDEACRALLEAEDTICLDRARLVTDAYREHEGEPVPLKRARAFAHVLGRMTLDLPANPVFAGNTSSRLRGWMLIPEHGFGPDTQVMLENDGLEGLFDGAIPQDLLDFWSTRSLGGHSGIGHLAVDLAAVVHRGLEAIIAEIEAHLPDGDEARREYREAMVISLRAVIAWAGRYAQQAARLAERTRDPELRACYLRVAQACRQVPARPARDLFEALQAIVLVHLATHIEGHGMSVSVGLLDRVLAPFIGLDFDPEYATDLLVAFRLKLNASSVYGRGSLTQAITIGGRDAAGRDCCNALTLCLLEACNRTRLGDAHVFLRWHPSLPQEVKRRAAELLAGGLSLPLLINDDPTAHGFIDAGVAEQDAWEYCVIGCNELGIPGRSAESATATSGNIQYLKLLTEALLEHPDPAAVGSMDALLACLERGMAERLAQMREWSLQWKRRSLERVPTPFTSALMRGCGARGQDLLEGMDYHLPGLYERGFTNTVNALAALEEHVFATGRLSLPQVVAAMRGDFPDPELRDLLRSGPRWGAGDPRADKWAATLLEMRERVLARVDAQFGHNAHMVCHVVRSLHHVDGKSIPASPDGRHAWTPVADSIGAEGGVGRAGPTGILNSVARIDAARYYRGGYNLNLTLPSPGTRPEAVLALVETFFGQGGQELQINCLDAWNLRGARERPAEHRDLLVRIAGFTARFVDLSDLEQREIIARAERAG